MNKTILTKEQAQFLNENDPRTLYSKLGTLIRDAELWLEYLNAVTDLGVESVDGILPDLSKNAQVHYAFDTEQEFLAAEPDLPVGAMVGKRWLYPDIAQARTIGPDIARTETVNRISVNEGTWIATKGGYALVGAYVGNSTGANNSNCYLAIALNGKTVGMLGSASDNPPANSAIGKHYYRVIIGPFNKGDEILLKCVADYGTLNVSSISCYYIPARFVEVDL